MSAALGDVDGAIAPALSGLRMFVLDQSAQDGGIASTVSIADAWSAVPSTRRRQAQEHLFWEVVAVLIARGIAQRTNDEAFRALLNQLREALMQAGDLEEPARWSQLIALAEESFVGGMSAYEIAQTVKAHSEDVPATVILYLAMIRSPSASLAEICGAQVLCLTTTRQFEMWTSPAMAHLASYIVTFWHEAIVQRPFALTAPKLFKDAIDGIDAPTPRNAARILTAALDATGVRASSAVREALSRIANDSERGGQRSGSSERNRPK